MSPARGGRSSGGPTRKGKTAKAAGKASTRKASTRNGQTGKAPTGKAQTSKSSPGKTQTGKSKHASKASSGKAPIGKISGKGPRGRTRGGGRSDARVVWPPQERTETARDAIAHMMRENGLARDFDADVERDARKAGQRAWAESEPTRRDLRDLPTFTIDPATARDFDDAISAEELNDGSVRVWVHIADVAAHVPAGSPIDLEARRRATSVYVPGAVVPMLPHTLSSDACSLIPGAERLTLTAELVLRGAKLASACFYRSLIRSDERLDYEQVDRIFAGRARASEPWAAPLAAARRAAAALQQAREHSGALTIDSLEPEFSFDEDGNVSDIRVRAQTESHRVIEHLMIAANEAVAVHLTQAAVPCLYRIHERPDPDRIRTLVEQLASLGVATPPLPDPLFPARAAELVGEISLRVDAHVRRTGQGRAALSSLVLRSLKQACYSPKNVGHSGLHSPCYCHFTSPIRRYPDLVCHRALLSSIGAGERAVGRRKLVELGEWTSERERDAAKIEHKADDIAACFMLEQRLFEHGFEQLFSGEVTGLIGAGAFVAFGPGAGGGSEQEDGGGEGGTHEQSAPVYEGMLPVRLMRSDEGSDWWELNEQGTILRGKRSGATLRLGDRIEVRVVRVDPTGGRVDLAPAPAA